jgi:hypothetical protein
MLKSERRLFGQNEPPFWDRTMLVQGWRFHARDGRASDNATPDPGSAAPGPASHVSEGGGIWSNSPSNSPSVVFLSLFASAPHFRSPNHLGFLSSGEQARAREWRVRRHRRASGRGRAASSSSREGRESSPPEGKHAREGCELVAVGRHERARELGATVASDTVDILGAGDGGVLC